MLSLVRAAARRASSGCAARFNSTVAAGTQPLVLLEHRDRVAIVTLNDPARLNPLTVPMGQALAETLAQLDYEKTGAVVITGAGKAFSAGGDLAFLQARAATPPFTNSHIMRSFYQGFYGALRSLPVPVLAAINGAAVGAGLGFAMGADLRLCGKNSRMGVTFVGLGLAPGMATTYSLPQALGPQLAARLLLTGELVDGAEAARIGLVLEAVEDADVLPRTIALAERIAAQSPIAVRSVVRSMRMTADEGLDRALWREADSQAHCYAGADLKEGVAAVAAKRKPSWSQWEGLKVQGK